MKIAYLTAGAAGMFCGSCMHDNALARMLIQMGHDCLLIPVYTPIRTDENDVSIDRVFMGGINVYLQQKLPFLAHLPTWMDGFLNLPSIIKPLTKNTGKVSPAFLGALTVSMLEGTEGRQRKEFQRLLGWLVNDVRPEVIVLTNLLIGGCIPELRRKTNARIFVTLQGDDIFLDSLPDRYRSEAIQKMKALVPKVDGFITHSQAYATTMSGLLGIDASAMHVVPLGIDPTDLVVSAHHGASRSDGTDVGSQSRPYTLGYLARMAPEKGLHRIVDAFIEVAKRTGPDAIFLRLAGWMGPQHADYWSEQQRKLETAGLASRYEYMGSVDRADKQKFFQSIDLFCVPTTYEEPKGLFLLEAIAAGVPYVQPAHGAFPEIHRRLGGGDLFDATSDQALVESLEAHILQRRSPAAPSPETLSELDIKTHARRIAQLLESNVENRGT